jgi:hypothetical protein
MEEESVDQGQTDTSSKEYPHQVLITKLRAQPSITSNLISTAKITLSKRQGRSVMEMLQARTEEASVDPLMLNSQALSKGESQLNKHLPSSDRIKTLPT